MFNRYWREFPWWFQLLQFVIMIFIFLGFALVLTYLLIPRLTEIPLQEITNITEHSQRGQIDAVLMMQFLMSLFAFTVPPLLFAYAAHPSLLAYLGLRPPGKSGHWLLSALLILSALPIMLAMTAWLQQYDFGESVKKAQEQNDNLMKGLMKMNNIGDFLKAFVVLAILPAVGEELFFRGIVMRLGAKIIRVPVIYIILSAVLFAWAHSNIYGLPAIFMAGLILGSIYYLTGSIWCSILAHLINNGLQIVLMFMANDNATIKGMTESNDVPWQFLVIGIPIFLITSYLLWKSRTPLPANWSDDYAGEKTESTDNFAA